MDGEIPQVCGTRGFPFDLVLERSPAYAFSLQAFRLVVVEAIDSNQTGIVYRAGRLARASDGQANDSIRCLLCW